MTTPPARPLMAAFAVTFVVAGLVFLLATAWTLRQASRLGQLDGTNLFLAATTGLMAMLVHVSILVYRDPAGRRDLLPALAVSKFSSSAAALLLATWHGQPGVLAVVAADLPLGLAALWLWWASREAS